MFDRDVYRARREGLRRGLGSGIALFLGNDESPMNYADNTFPFRQDSSFLYYFGLDTAGLARPLRPGFVVTVEPGIYFIPQLIDKWRAENLFPEYIDYDRVETYKDFGGLRNEEDVLITPDGHRVLGRRKPLTVEEVESASGRTDL